jgi:K(+)-stimulated pyrophosphate-energized sodium pump
MLTVVMIAGFAGLLIVILGAALFYGLNKLDFERGKNSELIEFVSEGLHIFAKRIFSSILQIVIYVSVVLFIFSKVFNKQFSWLQIAAFFIGCIVMGISAFIALYMIPKLLPRIIENSKGFLAESLNITLVSSGSVGFVILGFIVLGITGCYWFLGVSSLVGYALGIALAAYFLRIAGSLYKASADIGADIAATVEKGIPAFDRRNPATILDITGDFVADILGFGSDILSSYVFAVVACIVFAEALLGSGYIDKASALSLQYFPLFMVSIGVIAMVVSFLFSKFRIKMGKINNLLLEGIYLAVVVCGISTYVVLNYLNIEIFNMPGVGRFGFMPFVAYLIGLLGAVSLAFTSEYMTSCRYKPAQRIASEAENGTVVSLFNGFSIGLKSNGFFLIYIIIIATTSYYFAGLYGIAIAAMGMLSVVGSIMTTNIFTAFSSNTNKICKLSDESDIVKKNSSEIDGLGNTTAAVGNGFASGVAVISTLCLFLALAMIADVDLNNLLIIDLKLVSGLVIGVSLPFVFSGVLLRSLNKMILLVVDEVSRQFREIPFLYEEKGRPDVIKASDYNVCLSINALTIPGVIMVLSPIVLGYAFGIKMLVGFAFGTFLSGFNQGFYWANVGDVLHNVKHYIENGNYGGKDSTTYKYALMADNVGDAFKDLLSPSINILIKSVAIISFLVILFLA